MLYGYFFMIQKIYNKISVLYTNKIITENNKFERSGLSYFLNLNTLYDTLINQH